MKLLVDMNLSPAWVEFLATNGLEAVHWSTVGRGDAPDVEVMRWAADHGHVVLTNDLGFSAILSATQRRLPSVIQIRNDILTPAGIGPTVLTAIRQLTPQLSEGAILSIEASRSRVRILPLSD